MSNRSSPLQPSGSFEHQHILLVRLARGVRAYGLQHLPCFFALSRSPVVGLQLHLLPPSRTAALDGSALEVPPPPHCIFCAGSAFACALEAPLLGASSSFYDVIGI